MSDLVEQRASRGSASISTTMLGRLRKKDSLAWSKLVELFTPVIYQWGRRAGLQPNDAENVVQEVFLSIAKNLASFHRSEAGQTFRGWVWTIAHSKICNHFRHVKDRPQAAGGTDAHGWIQQLAITDPSSVDGPVSVENECLFAHRVLSSIRNDFKETTWQAFWRMVVKGHSSSEIAADLDMSPEAVRRAKCRVLKRFRDEWEALQ